jgi:hypothetical protein
LIAVCTSDGHVKVYRPPFCDFCAEWIEVCAIEVINFVEFDFMLSVLAYNWTWCWNFKLLNPEGAIPCFKTIFLFIAGLICGIYGLKLVGIVPKNRQKEMLFQIVTMSLVPIYGFVQYEEFKSFNIVSIHCCEYNMLFVSCLGCGHNSKAVWIFPVYWVSRHRRE